MDAYVYGTFIASSQSVCYDPQKSALHQRDFLSFFLAF